MLPPLIGFAVFGVIFLSAKNLGEGGENSNSNPTTPKFQAPPDPTTNIPSPISPIDPSDPENPEEIVEDPGPPVDPTKAVQTLTEALCKQIMACRKFSSLWTWDACVNGVQEYEYLSSAFGISSSLTFQEVTKAEGMGYSAGSNPLAQCLEGIKKFTCAEFDEEDVVEEDPDLEEKMEEEVPEEEGIEKNPLEGIELHFDSDKTPGCEKIFKPKEVICSTHSSPIKMHSNATRAFADTICSEATTCNPGLACEACYQGVLSDIKFADKIGLNRVSLQAIDYGLAVGIYSVNDEALGQCLEQIKKPGCGSADGLWDSDFPAALARFHQIMPRNENSCSRVFEQTPISCDTGSAHPITRFAEALCGQVVTCRPEINCDHCVSEVLNSESIPYQLGAGKIYSNYQVGKKTDKKITLIKVGDEIKQGRLILDETALEQCVSDIHEQTCIKIQLGVGDYKPGGYPNLITGISGLFFGGTGSCKLALTSPTAAK